YSTRLQSTLGALGDRERVNIGERMVYKVPSAIQRLEVEGMVPLIGSSVRQAERKLEDAVAPGAILDLTNEDTNRFPAPEWSLEVFGRAASGEGMTYTPYRGDSSVRADVAENVEQTLGIPATGVADVILTPGTQGALYTALSAIIE